MSSSTTITKPQGLEGKLLIAMPGLGDPRFERTVIFVCAHSTEGAMGLVINRAAENVTFPELLEQLEIDPGENADSIRVRYGGPVESGRGFVLHTPDFHSKEATLPVAGGYGLTGTIDVLRAMAEGDGPERRLVALGYAGWGPGQIEEELQENGWLSCDADLGLVFDEDDGDKWTRALSRLGVSPAMLSSSGGSA